MIVLKNTLRSYIRYPALNNHHHHQGSFRGLLPSSSSKTGAANLCDVSRLNKFGLETMWRVYFKTGFWMARIERAFFSPLLPSSPPPLPPPATTHNHPQPPTTTASYLSINFLRRGHLLEAITALKKRERERQRILYFLLPSFYQCISIGSIFSSFYMLELFIENAAFYSKRRQRDIKS